MQYPLQITIRDMPNSASLSQRIRTKANKLEHFYDNITGCRVVVDIPQKNHHQGKKFNVRIDITVPREELVINKVSDENVFIALRDAFNAAGRKLQEHKQKIRGDVKSHDTMVLTSYKKEREPAD